MLFREAIDVHSEDREKHINTLCEWNADLLNVKAGGTYNNHCTLKGKQSS
jgi:hypothetical protein